MDTKQLRQAFEQLEPIEGKPEPHTWDFHRKQLRRHVKRDIIENFLQWSTIQATMFVGKWELTDNELAELMDAPNWADWAKAIEEPGVGNPQKIDNWTSGNLIHQAYHLKQWRDVTGRKVSDLTGIVEFGGGYGAMALICNRLGFNGVYLIFDLPEFSLLQEYYTRQCGVNALCVQYGKIKNYEPADLFIACYSISEAPRELRLEVLENVPANSYLFAFQGVYAGIDLKEEFSYIVSKMDDVNWTWIQNKNMPLHSYLIGEKQNA